ncbi:universal stress protein [Desulfobacterales bacterium HSG17]|nr:universal stress protein [Desulfobacterales bacterium HSG17]
MGRQPKYKRILFCSDFSEDANFAFQHAVDFCLKHKAELRILYIIKSLKHYSGPMIDFNLPDFESWNDDTKREKIVEQALASLRLNYEPHLKKVENYVFAIRFGSPDVEILNYARENDIWIIVLGVVGQTGGTKGRILKTAANVSKYAPCQVVTIGTSKV